MDFPVPTLEPTGPFEMALLVGILISTGLGPLLPRGAPVDDRWRWRLLPVVFVVSWTGLLLFHHHRDPTWTPHGADWDTWLQSAMAFGGSVPHTPNRWPAWGALVYIVHLFTPGPLFLKAQWTSHLCTAASVTALYLLGARWLGLFGGVVAAGAVATFPMVVVLSTWTGAYSFWTAAGLWTVASVVEGVVTGRPIHYFVAGFCLALEMAIMDKGLGVGLALGSVLAFAILLRPRKLLFSVGASLAGFGLVALSYIVFPAPLATLDAMARAGREAPIPASLPVEGVSRAADTAHLEAVGYAADIEKYTTDGYVFGRQMSPRTIAHTLRFVSTLSLPHERRNLRGHSFEVLEATFPKSRSITLAVLLAAPLLALWGGFRRFGGYLVGVGGISAVVAGTVPALEVELNHKFLLPLYTLAPFLLILALLAPIGRWRLRYQSIALLAVPVFFLEGAPWRDYLHIEDAVRPLDVRATEAIRIYYDLRRSYPGTPVDVTAPGPIGLLALEGRDGRMLGLDPRFFDVSVPPSPNRLVLAVGLADSEADTPPKEEDLLLLRSLEGRTILKRWPTLPDTRMAPVLAGPRVQARESGQQ